MRKPGRLDGQVQALQQRIRRLVNAQASDDEVEREARSFALTGSIERAIWDAIGEFATGAARETRERWMRRAAEDGQVWALWELGREQIIDREDLAHREDAREWLSQAAAAGHRGAALMLGRLAEHRGAREIGLLVQAYGGGDDGHDGEITSSEVCAAAIEMALAHRTSDPDLAEEWYRRGLAVTGWKEPRSDWARQWTVEVVEHALWLHKRGYVGRCDVILREKLPEILKGTWDDRITVYEEAHKPWRYDYSMARSADAARFELLAHLLEQHTWDTAEQADVLGAMADTEASVCGSGEEKLRNLTERNLGVILEGRDAGAGRFPAYSVLRRATEDDAWRAVAYVLDTIVPGVFEEVGRDDIAQTLRSLAPDQGCLPWNRWHEPSDREEDPSQVPPFWETPNDPLEPLSNWVLGTGLRAALGGALPCRMPEGKAFDDWRVLAELLTESGLTGALHPETLGIIVDISIGPSFRLLRGEPAWFALWLAAGPVSYAADWQTEWERVGGILTGVLRMVLAAEGNHWAPRIAARLRTDYQRFWDVSKSP